MNRKVKKTRRVRSVDAPPWVGGLDEFYSFLDVSLTALRGALDDLDVGIPRAVQRLEDIVSPKVPVFDKSAIRLPLFFFNIARKFFDNKPPLRFDSGIGAMREPRFLSALLLDLDSPMELAKTVRLVGVFAEYRIDRLSEFSALLDMEVAALESRYISEDNVKRLLPATLVFAVGASVAWSAFAAQILGLDLVQSVWEHFRNRAAHGLGLWGKIIAWSIVFCGLATIAGWAIGRHRLFNQRHRLLRIKRCLDLYIRSSSDMKKQSNPESCSK